MGPLLGAVVGLCGMVVGLLMMLVGWAMTWDWRAFAIWLSPEDASEILIRWGLLVGGLNVALFVVSFVIGSWGEGA